MGWTRIDLDKVKQGDRLEIQGTEYDVRAVHVEMDTTHRRPATSYAVYLHRVGSKELLPTAQLHFYPENHTLDLQQDGTRTVIKPRDVKLLLG